MRIIFLIDEFEVVDQQLAKKLLMTTLIGSKLLIDHQTL